MDSFKKFFNINIGTKKRHMHPILNTKRPHETVPVMHRTKKDIYKFKILKKMQSGTKIITNREAQELMKRFNVKFSTDSIATLGNTGISLYKNPSGEGYILQK